MTFFVVVGDFYTMLIFQGVATVTSLTLKTSFFCKIVKLIGIPIAFFLLSAPAKSQQEGMLGEIKMFAGKFPPRGWAFCEGQLLPIAQNQALFSILGTTYGGDGRSTFALPDLRGRVAMGAGTGPGLETRVLGRQPGYEDVVLTLLNLPVHSHTATVSGGGSALVEPVLSTDNAVRAIPQEGDVPAVVNTTEGFSVKQLNAFGPPTNTVHAHAEPASSATPPSVSIGINGANQAVDIGSLPRLYTTSLL